MKILIMIGMMLLTLAPLAVTIWYVPFRFARLFDVNRAWWLYLIMAVIVIASMMGMYSFTTSMSRGLGLVRTAAGFIFVVHLYLTMLLLVLDVLRLGVPIPARSSACIAIGLAIAVTASGTWWAGQLKVTTLEIPIDELQKEITVMHITDVHLGQHHGREHLEWIVHETNRLNPDLILITGDLVDGHVALEPGVLDPIQDLIAPSYFVTGNHEYYVDTTRALEVIASHGVRILHNEVVHSHGLQIVGLDYMNADENHVDMHAVNQLTICEELPKLDLDQDKPIIVLHHSPVGLEYVEQAGADLMLAGHTHGGQVFPGTVLGGLIFPINEGLHKRGGTKIYVSAGAGTFGPRVRLGSSNEITFIRLIQREET